MAIALVGQKIRNDATLWLMMVQHLLLASLK